ncbi:MAG: carboxymuconolactone decarboxylase family protein [Acidobacteria bacterium]|nr:carboxymuconolactone decarboxylase family protein [Acidobacteriota bacterium]
MTDRRVRSRFAPSCSRSTPSRRRPPRARRAVALLVAAAAIAAAAPAAAQEEAPPRIPPLESVEEGINIIRTLANHPALAEAWLGFARYVLGDNTLPPRDRELLILRIGYLRGSEYEWGQHTRIARSVGVTDEEILRVIDGPDAAGWSTFDSALLRAVDELHHDSEVSDATWAELSGRYDTRQLMDLVFTVGQYNLVSIALRTFRVPLDEGVEGFPR